MIRKQNSLHTLTHVTIMPFLISCRQFIRINNKVATYLLNVTQDFITEIQGSVPDYNEALQNCNIPKMHTQDSTAEYCPFFLARVGPFKN